MARITGIGGVFLKARDPEALAAWYSRHLGVQLAGSKYAIMAWTDEVPAGTGMTTWSLFPEDAASFGSGAQGAMVNYRVDDMDGILAQLEQAGARIDPKREDYDFGRFAWAEDPEGNRFELWEPASEPQAS